jgi:hypothetical protein
VALGLFALGGGELELLREIVPDVVVLAAEAPRDAVAGLVSAGGSQKESDGSTQYCPYCDPRREQTNIRPVWYSFMGKTVRSWLRD